MPLYLHDVYTWQVIIMNSEIFLHETHIKKEINNASMLLYKHEQSFFYYYFKLDILMW